MHFDIFELSFFKILYLDTVGSLMSILVPVHPNAKSVLRFCVARTNGINLNCATASVSAAFFVFQLWSPLFSNLLHNYTMTPVNCN